MSSELTLVVGATGVLGSLISHILIGSGEKVRCLVRPLSSEKAQKLKEDGAEIAFGDLKDVERVTAALEGVTKLVITATSILSRVEGDSIDAVDRIATLRLVEIAMASPTLKHIVYISFPPHPLASPLQTSKRAVEEKIISDASTSSRVTYTILQPGYFVEIWFSPHLSLDLANKKGKVYGTGDAGRQWYVSVGDVAKAAVASLDLSNASVINRVFPFGGPEGLTQRELLRRVEEKKSVQLDVTCVPSEALRGQLEGASNDVEKVIES